ncbi:cytochrome c [Algoriphagus boseongensis]|uniref:Cytochrome c n=1 Tax=Algoriphagus boseongensis TaxID=1442587 RepID=A0A4R6T377_9BACT|nr:cytochrome c [Algoriphagus boseongensis]TDQ15143.1 cytochrome c [Algoriphagus boseongensis]
MRLIFGLLGLIWITSCSPKSTNEENTLAQISDPDVMIYAVNGKTLYENYCGNCHQSDGKGLGKLIPPLREADYFKESVHRTIWIIRHGQEGPIEVNGEIYDQKMPANPQLKPLEIAQITTYLYNIWGMEEGVISAPDVEKYLQTKPENY